MFILQYEYHKCSDANNLAKVLSHAHFFFVNIGGCICMLGCLLLDLLKETEHDFKALVIEPWNRVALLGRK